MRSADDWSQNYQRVCLRTRCGCTREVTVPEHQMITRRISVPVDEVRYVPGQEPRPFAATREFEFSGEMRFGIPMFEEIYRHPRFTEEDVQYWKAKYEHLFSLFHIDEGL